MFRSTCCSTSGQSHKYRSRNRDKVDFLLVSILRASWRPRGWDTRLNLGYVAQALETALARVQLKTPCGLNRSNRVLIPPARRCRSLDDYCMGGVLTQGPKSSKRRRRPCSFLPIALVAFPMF